MDRAPENEGRMKDDAKENGDAANSIRDRRRAFIHTEPAVTGGYPVDLPSESVLITNPGGKALVKAGAVASNDVGVMDASLKAESVTEGK